MTGRRRAGGNERNGALDSLVLHSVVRYRRLLPIHSTIHDLHAQCTAFYVPAHYLATECVRASNSFNTTLHGTCSMQHACVFHVVLYRVMLYHVGGSTVTCMAWHVWRRVMVCTDCSAAVRRTSHTCDPTGSAAAPVPRPAIADTTLHSLPASATNPSLPAARCSIFSFRVPSFFLSLSAMLGRCLVRLVARSSSHGVAVRTLTSTSGQQPSLYTAVAHTVGGRNGSSSSSDGNLKVALSVPKAMGGPGGAGTNPEQVN